MDSKMQMQNNGKAIVLNRMYVGDYLFNNIGHEVINFFKAENGKHYIYLNSRGNIAEVHRGKIGFMLFVKYHTEGVVEVIGKAVGLEDVGGVTCSLPRNLGEERVDLSTEQKKYINKENIFYKNASIIDIFKGAGQQNIYITFEAKAVYRTKRNKQIFICFNGADENFDKEKTIKLAGYKQAKASLKQYIYPSSENNDYKQLIEIINDNEYWETEPVKKLEDEIKTLEEKLDVHRRDSLFDICQIQNDENKFSNALAYFMIKYPDLWQDFFNQHGINIENEFTVTREAPAKIEDDKWNHTEFPSGGRIDLLVRDNNNIIVIENKIKSDVNTVPTDRKEKNQLDRYVNYITWLTQINTNIKPYFLILTPNYNKPKLSEEMNKKYKVITYRELYDFLKVRKYKVDANFDDFLDAMRRHTHDNVNDYLYYEMLEKFIRRINEVKQEK
jgi:hypothetical protein